MNSILQFVLAHKSAIGPVTLFVGSEILSFSKSQKVNGIVQMVIQFCHAIGKSSFR
jgi:hypothetical protein